MILAYPVKMTSCLSQAFIKSLDRIIKTFTLVVSYLSWGFYYDFVKNIGILRAWLSLYPEFCCGLVSELHYLSFAYFLDGRLDIYCGWYGAGKTNRAIFHFFVCFMELKVLIDWIFPGEFIDFTSSEALVETFSFGEFESYIGNFFHFLPIFHRSL